jgi:hypothetical protein
MRKLEADMNNGIRVVETFGNEVGCVMTESLFVESLRRPFHDGVIGAVVSEETYRALDLEYEIQGLR